MIKLRSSFISSIFGKPDLRVRSDNGLGRLQLFGMSGTFGHGVEKHCDSWEIGEPTPDKVTIRKSMRDLAQERRSEASERIGQRISRGLYDISSR